MTFQLSDQAVLTLKRLFSFYGHSLLDGGPLATNPHLSLQLFKFGLIYLSEINNTP